MFQFFPEKEVKSKINNLRTYFAREMQKIKKSDRSGAGSKDKYRSSWVHFDQMLFIKDTITSRKTISSLDRVNVMTLFSFFKDEAQTFLKIFILSTFELNKEI